MSDIQNNSKQEQDPFGGYLGVGFAIGAGIGAAIGASIGNMGLGLAIGVAIGSGMALALNAGKKRRNK